MTLVSKGWFDVALVGADGPAVRPGQEIAPGRYSVVVNGAQRGTVEVLETWHEVWVDVIDGEPRFTPVTR